MKKRSLGHTLPPLIVAWTLCLFAGHAQAETPAAPSSPAHEDVQLAQRTSDERLRQETMRIRSTTVLPGHTIQSARPPSKKQPSDAADTTTKAWGEYETPEDGLEAFKKAPVAITLRSGEHLDGTINYYTEDAVLVVTDTGSLHIIEIQDIRAIDTLPKPEKHTLSLSEDAAQSLKHKQQQAIRDKIRDYRLREAHQHVGRAMRISGGTLIGLGAIAEIWGLTVLSTVRNSNSVSDGPFGNAMAVPVAIAGAPMFATGVGLLIGANIKRRRAIQNAREKNITYSVVPQKMGRGAGAAATVNF